MKPAHLIEKNRMLHTKKRRETKEEEGKLLVNYIRWQKIYVHRKRKATKMRNFPIKKRNPSYDSLAVAKTVKWNITFVFSIENGGEKKQCEEANKDFFFSIKFSLPDRRWRNEMKVIQFKSFKRNEKTRMNYISLKFFIFKQINIFKCWLFSLKRTSNVRNARESAKKVKGKKLSPRVFMKQKWSVKIFI